MDGGLFHRSSFSLGLFAETARVKSWFHPWFEVAVDILPLPVVILPKRFTTANPNYPVRKIGLVAVEPLIPLAVKAEALDRASEFVQASYPVRGKLPTKIDSSSVASVRRVFYSPVAKYMPERKPKFL